MIETDVCVEHERRSAPAARRRMRMQSGTLKRLNATRFTILCCALGLEFNDLWIIK